MPADNIRDEAIRCVFMEVVNGRGTHNEFVRNFAACIVHADITNLAILRKAAINIIDKYHLAGYVQPLRKVSNG